MCIGIAFSLSIHQLIDIQADSVLAVVNRVEFILIRNIVGLYSNYIFILLWNSSMTSLVAAPVYTITCSRYRFPFSQNFTSIYFITCFLDYSYSDGKETNLKVISNSIYLIPKDTEQFKNYLLTIDISSFVNYLLSY